MIRQSAYTLTIIALVSLAPSEIRATTFNDPESFLESTSSLIYDGFENPPWAPGALAQPVTSFGVTWSSANLLYGGTIRVRTGSLSLTDGDQTPDFPDMISAVFPAGVTALGAWVNGTGQASQSDVTLTIFDSADAIIESVLVPTKGFLESDWFFVGITSSQEIYRAEFEATSQAIGLDDFSIDDFSFGVAIPEPSTGLLLLFGLILAQGLGSAASRPRRKWWFGATWLRRPTWWRS